MVLLMISQECHGVVDVERYYDNCYYDVCGCDLGGDCTCLCDVSLIKQYE